MLTFMPTGNLVTKINLACMSCLWTVGGSQREPGENPREHRENMQTPQEEEEGLLQRGIETQNFLI